MDIFDKLLSVESRTKYLKEVLANQQVVKNLIGWLNLELWVLRKEIDGIKPEAFNFHAGRIEELKRLIKALSQNVSNPSEKEEIWWDTI